MKIYKYALLIALGISCFVPKSFAENISSLDIATLQQKANQGNTDALLELGNKYRTGNGVSKNPLQAKKLYEQAAMGGNNKALLNLGLMYYNGTDIPENGEVAIQCFTKCAAQKDSDCQYMMGLIYQEGRIVHQSNEIAKQHFDQSCKNHNPKACLVVKRFEAAGFR